MSQPSTMSTTSTAELQANLAATFELLIEDESYFLGYQQRWIDDDSPLKLDVKCRRGGITYATSFRAVDKCVRIHADDPGFRQYVVSRDLATARDFIQQYVRLWCDLLEIEASGVTDGEVTWQEATRDGKGQIMITAYVARFPGGQQIISLSSNPQALAGKGGDILIDEADLHDNFDLLYDMAYPLTTWGYQLEVVSAYDPEKTADSPFAQLVDRIYQDGPESPWSIHQVTLEDAIQDGFVERVNLIKQARHLPPETRDEFRARIRAGCRSQQAYDSQYACKPNKTSGEGVVRPLDLAAARQSIDIVYRYLEGDAGARPIDPCIEALYTGDFWSELLSERKGLYYLGYDVARRGDLAAVYLWQQLYGRMVTRAVVAMAGVKFESQKQLMRHAFLTHRGLRGAGDETGMGGPTCEALLDEFGEWRWLSVTLAPSTKLDVMLHLGECYEGGLVTIPAEPRAIAADFACLKKASTPGGRLSIEAAPNEFLPRSHADIATAGALGLYAWRELTAADVVAVNVGSGGGERHGLAHLPPSQRQAILAAHGYQHGGLQY